MIMLKKVLLNRFLFLGLGGHFSTLSLSHLGSKLGHSLSSLSGKLALSSDSRAVLHEDIGEWQENQRKESGDGTAPVDAQGIVKRSGEEWEGCAE